MSDVEAFDLWREGFLFGTLGGVLLTLVLREASREFVRWRRHVRNDGLLAQLQPRCELNDECIRPCGHSGDCDPQEY
jgi:hypothetical protein